MLPGKMHDTHQFVYNFSSVKNEKKEPLLLKASSVNILRPLVTPKYFLL